MSGFDDAWKENRHVWESTKNLAKSMYLAGTQSRQAEVDELQKHKEILLSELYLMGDAIQYNRVLNLLKGNQND